MLLDAILMVLLAALVGTPIVIAFDRAKREMESADDDVN